MPEMITLVTTVLNDREGTARFLSAMAAQTRRPDEIVVVDGGSTDGTWELLQGSDCRVFQEPGGNVARGRNLAIAAARGDIIASTDIGCDWDPEWLEELVAPLETDPRIQYVAGSWRVRPEEIAGDWMKTEFHLKGGYHFLATPDATATSRSVAYRKTLWERIGGYPEDLTLAADDTTFDLLVRKAAAPAAAAERVHCYWHRFDHLTAVWKEERRNFFGDGEAGIRGRFIAGSVVRLLVEFGGLLSSAVLFTFGQHLAATCAATVALLSVAVRLWKFRGRIRALRADGVSFAWVRLMALFYTLKFAALHGYAAGWRRGRTRCRDIRRRLRETKPLSW